MKVLGKFEHNICLNSLPWFKGTFKCNIVFESSTLDFDEHYFLNTVHDNIYICNKVNVNLIEIYFAIHFQLIFSVT